MGPSAETGCQVAEVGAQRVPLLMVQLHRGHKHVLMKRKKGKHAKPTLSNKRSPFLLGAGSSFRHQSIAAVHGGWRAQPSTLDSKDRCKHSYMGQLIKRLLLLHHCCAFLFARHSSCPTGISWCRSKPRPELTTADAHTNNGVPYS